MAMKLARVATGRFKTVSMWGAFHGASLDTISISGESLFRKNIGPLLPGTEHVPPADPVSLPVGPKRPLRNLRTENAPVMSHMSLKKKKTFQPSSPSRFAVRP